MPARSSAEDLEAAAPLIAGRYRIESLLGQGGVGAVYVVRDTTDLGAKPIALKRLRATEKPNVAALFEREYQTLAGLQHPGIVSVYDYASDAEGPFYTMELVAGHDLAKHAPMPWREACACLRDAASILGVLHARGLLHRDLSPRNLLRSENGRLKLIDFGALCPFGPSADLVGTPPFIPPEALRGESLDPRSDLFALGALGYWLLTGSHAFPARHLSDLPRLHERPPALPSDLLSLLRKPGEQSIPAELDALLLALLRVDKTARPSGTAELIDRLSAIAELEREADGPSAQGYLDSKVFVGRERERAQVRAALGEARGGKVRTVLVEGVRGLGRSRLMQELLVDLQLAGATAVALSQERHERPFAAASELALALLQALPRQAQAAARPHASELALASAALSKQLSVVRTSLPGTAAAELRVRVQTAFQRWLSELSADRTIVLLVDDLHTVDEESRACLATLAHFRGRAQLLLVLSVQASAPDADSPGLHSLRHMATRLLLPPLTASETLSLLRSVFGAVPFLERTAERLFRSSSGDPSYCLELAQHLVRTQLARYVDGAWELPSNLDVQRLPASRADAELTRLVQLSPAARTVARVLSVPHHGALSLAECVELSTGDQTATVTALDELGARGLLRASPEGYELLHDAVRQELCTELTPAERERIHLQLGRRRLRTAGSDRVQLLHASLQLLRGGELEQSLVALRTAGSKQNYESLHQTARLFEEAYLLLCSHQLGPYARASALSTLSLASYHVDRRFARYADDAVACFEHVLRLPLAKKLERFLGGKLALITALSIAAVARLGHRHHAPSLRELVQLGIRACVALSGTASCSIDPQSGRRYSEVLRPLRALGRSHGAALASELAMLFAQGVEDRPARAVAELRSMIAFMDSDVQVRGVTPEMRTEALAGALFCLGVNACWRDDGEALQLADRLETFSPLYVMSADYLRSNYYGAQGDLVQAEDYRKRVELHAVQLGNTWQVEYWAPADEIKIALRTNDALRAKRAADALARAAVDAPSMAREERNARGAYFMLRGKYQQAIELVSQEVEPQAVTGWARSRGTLARCHNALGEHERAREVCLDVLSRLTDEDLAYTMQNLQVQIELALAEAGLGRLENAREQLDALIVRHLPNRGALTLGALHEARCRVALMEGDLASAHAHLERMDGWLRPTGIGLLRESMDALERGLRALSGPRPDEPQTAPQGHEWSEQLHSRVELLLTRDRGQTRAERAQTGLQLALELSSASTALLVFQDEPHVHCHDGAAPPALSSWAHTTLAAYSIDEQTMLEADTSAVTDTHALDLELLHYVFIPLWGQQADQPPLAGLVLGFEGSLRRVPDSAVLRSLGLHLESRDSLDV